MYGLQAVDAVYFSSANKDGYYLVTATARRQNGMIQVLTYLRVRVATVSYQFSPLVLCGLKMSFMLVWGKIG